MPSAIKIDHDVPLPEPRCSKYPFDQMRIGDSFLIDIDQAAPTAVAQAAAQYAKRHPEYKFTVRIMRGEHGTRVWRILPPGQKPT